MMRKGWRLNPELVKMVEQKKKERKDRRIALYALMLKQQMLSMRPRSWF